MRLSAHPFDDNPYYSGHLDVLIIHGYAGRHVFLNHSFQDRSLLNQIFHKFSFAETDYTLNP